MTHIEQRIGTAANWTAINPILNRGEAGHESDTTKWKIGDGVTRWNLLPYKVGVSSVAGRSGAVVLSPLDVPGVATLASPAFTGTPTAPTQNSGDSSTRLATTAFVAQTFAPLNSPNLIGVPTAPTQNTSANGTSIATTAFVKNLAYAPVASPAFTGAPTAPTQVVTDSSTRLATTAFAKAAVASAGTWIDYTPSVLGGAVGTGSRSGRYAVIGKTVLYRMAVSLGPGFNMTGLSLGLPLPVSSIALGFSTLAGHSVEVVDVGTGNYRLISYCGTATGVTMWIPGTNGLYQSVTATAPFTWAAGDVINFSGYYETN